MRELKSDSTVFTNENIKNDLAPPINEKCHKPISYYLFTALGYIEISIQSTQSDWTSEMVNLQSFSYLVNTSYCMPLRPLIKFRVNCDIFLCLLFDNFLAKWHVRMHSTW